MRRLRMRRSVCFKCFICSRRILQMICLDVAKVDLDVAYTCMLQEYVSSVFRCFIRMFASVSSGCCICLQWFSNVFHVFFASVSDAGFKCFICILLYVATIACGYFKNRSDVAYEIRVGNGRRREQRPGWSGTTTGALPHEPNALGARSLAMRAASGR
jgi:hypothetical protein